MGTDDAQECTVGHNHDRRFKSIKKILLLNNGHLTGYEPDGNIHISSGKKFRDVIAKLFPPQTRQRRGIESALRRKWVRYDK